MHSPFHAVARGLRLTHAGFLLACWGGASILGITWLISNTYYGDSLLRTTLWVTFWAAVLLGVGGVIVGFVGRVRCLKTPEGLPAARGRVLAAIALEGGGWASLFVGIGVMIAMIYTLLPSAPWIPAIGMGVSGLMIFGGRIMFLRFLRFLARGIEDKPSARRARLSLTVFLLDWAAALVAWGVAVAGSMLWASDVTNPIALVVCIVAGMSGMYGLFLYDRLLGGLARSVRQIAHDADKEEVEEELAYRAESRPDDDDT